MNLLPLTNNEDRQIGRLITLQALQIPDKPCYLTGNTTYSFAQVNCQVNRYAEGLQRLGVQQGDRVVIYMRSCVEFIFIALASNKLGAIWVPVNGDYKGTWLAETVADSQARIIVTDTDKYPRLEQALPALDASRLIIKSGSSTLTIPDGATLLASFNELSDAEPVVDSISYGDTSSILWTSGTTGKSKGVLQPHNVWIQAAENIHRCFDTFEGDVVYNCLPLYNTGAWVTSIFRAMITGIPCALDEHFSASDFWQRIAFYKATETTTLGAMHMFLWQAPEQENDAANTLRCANVVPLASNLVKPFMKRFGLQKIQKGYGQSEAASILLCLEEPDRTTKANNLGTVAPGIELTLRDEAGRLCAQQEVGEFCIKPTKPFVIFNGYFDNPEATRRAYHGDWYRTGDLGLQDSDGDFYFIDRKSDYIRDKGRNISSLQVEAAVMAHPAVAAVACFGIPSQHIETETELKIDVVLKPGEVLDATRLARFINETAPYFFVPRYIEFVEALPYTPTNKVQKYKLREKGLAEAVWDRDKDGFRIDK